MLTKPGRVQTRPLQQILIVSIQRFKLDDIIERCVAGRTPEKEISIILVTDLKTNKLKCVPVYIIYTFWSFASPGGLRASSLEALGSDIYKPLT